MQTQMKADSVNARLRALIRERGMTMTAVSRRSGIEYQSLVRAANGRRCIYAEELCPLAEALSTTPGVLLGLQGQ